MAKGYTQTKEIGYYDTFSPMTKMIIVRCLLVIVATQIWSFSQLDVNDAFLHEDLHKQI